VEGEAGATEEMDGGCFLVRGRGGPTTPRARTDLGGIPVLGISCFSLSISGTTTRGGEDEGGKGGGEVEGG
jgi:hypothetical protein